MERPSNLSPMAGQLRSREEHKPRPSAWLLSVPLPPNRAPYFTSPGLAFSISKMGVMIELPSRIPEISQVTRGIVPGIKCKLSLLLLS